MLAIRSKHASTRLLSVNFVNVEQSYYVVRANYPIRISSGSITPGRPGCSVHIYGDTARPATHTAQRPLCSFSPGPYSRPYSPGDVSLASLRPPRQPDRPRRDHHQCEPRRTRPRHSGRPLRRLGVPARPAAWGQTHTPARSPATASPTSWSATRRSSPTAKAWPASATRPAAARRSRRGVRVHSFVVRHLGTDRPGETGNSRSLLDSAAH